MKMIKLIPSAAVVIALAACGPKPATETSAPAAAAAPQAAPEAAPAAPVAPTLVEVVANDNCGIDAPTPGTEHDKATVLAVWGYAINRANWTIPAVVAVRVASLEGGPIVVVPASRGSRKDVAEALNNPDMENSGFGAEVDVTGLPAGSYMVSVLQEIDGQLSVCNSALPISLK